MRKFIVQIIAVALVALGFFDLYRDVSVRLIHLSGSTIDVYLKVFFSFVFYIIEIYGGVQLFRLQEVGRKLALIDLFQLLWIIVVSELPSLWASRSRYLESVNIKYLIFIISMWLLYVLAFVFLLNHKVIELMSKRDDLIRRIGFILASFVPGLGRALTGNFWAGMVLFEGYALLMIAKLGTDSSPAYLGWVGKLFYYLVVWRIFSTIDWNAVKNFVESEQRAVGSVPGITSE